MSSTSPKAQDSPILSLRKILQMSQRELAHHLGLSFNTVQYGETGRLALSEATFERIRLRLGAIWDKGARRWRYVDGSAYTLEKCIEFREPVDEARQKAEMKQMQDGLAVLIEICPPPRWNQLREYFAIFLEKTCSEFGGKPIAPTFRIPEKSPVGEPPDKFIIVAETGEVKPAVPADEGQVPPDLGDFPYEHNAEFTDESGQTKQVRIYTKTPDLPGRSKDTQTHPRPPRKPVTGGKR
jgi:transcriptional regulator with XRE-family HTH domain